VLIADDHTLLLEALVRLVAEEFEVVGTAQDGRALVTAALELKPDVVVVDVSMPLLNGIDAARQLKQALPETAIVVVTMNEDAEVASEAFRAGVSAFVLKRSAASELLTAIREAAHHRLYVTPLLSEGLMTWVKQGSGTGSSPPRLTSRQREVIQLVAEGHSMKEIGAILKITPRTVAFHKYRIMDQLNVKTTAELVRFAITHHLT
jgi:DNA-binding NarL/FixJ family response regulator